MDDYMKRIIQEEDAKLRKFLDSAVQTINLGFRNELISIERTSYEG